MPTLALALRALKLAIAVTALLAAAPTGTAFAAPCDAGGADAAGVAAARATVQAACDCATAGSTAAWRSCVRNAVAPLIGSSLSTSCAAHVRRVEQRSTCGRTDRIVCCRTSRTGRTSATVKRPGSCTAPEGGSACASAIPYLTDACTESGCAVVPACGNGIVESGEACDPPNGTTCNNLCASCAAAPGQILVGCSAASENVTAAASADRLLVAYNDRIDEYENAGLGRRLDGSGAFVDTTPLTLTGLLPGTNASLGWVDAATSDGAGFYVAWETWADWTEYIGGRRVPSSGPITSAPELLASNFAIGSCRSSISGPLNLAPRLDGASFHLTSRVLYGCMGQILFETLTGVGVGFNVPPPGLISRGPAPIARGANDVAATWWGALADPNTPPYTIPFLAASWVAPTTGPLIQLSSGYSAVAPALAAVGDTFVSVWTSGTELRANRFTRAAGSLDPDGGFLVATAGGTIGAIAAATEGSQVLVAWRESAGPGQSAIRAIRIAADGTVPDPTPIEVVTTTANADLSVAANAAATLVAFTRAEAAGFSVRAVLLGE